MQGSLALGEQVLGRDCDSLPPPTCARLLLARSPLAALARKPDNNRDSWNTVGYRCVTVVMENAMQLCLVRSPDLMASLLPAGRKEHLFDVLDQVARADGCEWSVYDGRLVIDFQLPAKWSIMGEWAGERGTGPNSKLARDTDRPWNSPGSLRSSPWSSSTVVTGTIPPCGGKAHELG